LAIEIFDWLAEVHQRHRGHQVCCHDIAAPLDLNYRMKTQNRLRDLRFEHQGDDEASREAVQQICLHVEQISMPSVRIHIEPRHQNWRCLASGTPCFETCSFQFAIASALS
jgi:hypothetical protein